MVFSITQGNKEERDEAKKGKVALSLVCATSAIDKNKEL